MPQSGTPSRLIWQIEDDTALILTGRDALRNLKLFVRAQARRGYIDGDTLALLEDDIARIERSILHRLDYIRWLREQPDRIGENSNTDD